MKKWINIKILAILAVLIAPTVVFGNVLALDEAWGPQDRRTYTWEEPATTPTFNSIINNPELGKEMNFVRVREYGSTEPYEDYVDIEVGKEYEVYVYYHNNASASLNDSGAGLAQNVRLQTELPSELHDGDTAVIKGTINWGTTGNMQNVWDTAFLTAHDTVYLRYVPDSAVIHNQGSANGLTLDADALFGDGVLLAHSSQYWGIIPGCNEYAGYVTYRIKADQPKFYIEKEVSIDNSTWSDTIDVEPGKILHFKITYTNYGTTKQTSVRVVDKLSDKLEYIEGSTVAITPDAPEGVGVADKIFREGLVIGDFEPGEVATITYSVRVVGADDFSDCSSVVYNDAHVATANGTEYDKVKITVNKECLPDPEELPDTGPLEIVMAVVIVLGIGGGIFYLYRTKKTLIKVNNSLVGGDKEDGISGDVKSHE